MWQTTVPDTVPDVVYDGLYVKQFVNYLGLFEMRKAMEITDIPLQHQEIGYLEIGFANFTFMKNNGNRIDYAPLQ